MSETGEPNPRELLAALGVTNADAVERVHGGMDTLIWHVVRGETVYALRLFRTDQTETCRREVAAMETARAGGLPVPEIHAEGVWNHRPMLLLGWCAGQPLLEWLLSQPERLPVLATEFGRMQARIHAVPPTTTLRRLNADWIGWAKEEKGALQERLREITQESNALLHLDYHPMNVMSDGEAMTAVLDWANACIGDPRADLARTIVMLRLNPTLPSFTRKAQKSVVRRLLKAWQQGYRETAGAMSDCALFYAWAAAVIVGDFVDRIGQPGVTWTENDLKRLRRWTRYWKWRGGINSL